MKKTVVFLTLLLTLLQIGWAQQRDRLGELNVVCRNWIVTHTSVAPDGSLWMATECGEIYRADDIHSPWHILKEGKLLGDQGETFENIVAFDRNTAVIVGYMWGDYFKRTTTGGRLWNTVDYVSKRGYEWFHPVWRGQGGTMWTASQDGYLAFSADSGRTFTPLLENAYFDETIDDIYIRGDYSIDGGETFIPYYSYLEIPVTKGLNFENVTTTMTAGTPYIVKWDKANDYDTADPDIRDLKSPTFNSVTITATPDNTVFDGGSFVGVYAPHSWTTENKSILLLGANNQLFWPKPDGANTPYINACRAYFQLDGGSEARELVLNFTDDATGIASHLLPLASHLLPLAPCPSEWYTLDGRKLSGKPTAKGMYIVRGAKIVIN